MARWGEHLARKAGLVKARNKRNAVPRGGYASGLEAEVGAALKLLEAAGAISDLQRQPSYEVQPDGCELIRWRPDFSFTENGRRVCLEAKGLSDGEYRMKAKLFRWKYRGEIELRIVVRGRGGALVGMGGERRF